MIQTVNPNPIKPSSSTTIQKKKPVIPDVLYHQYEENGEKKTIRYNKGNFLGKGGFAECYELRNAETHAVYAGKIIFKDSITNTKAKQKLKMEIKIHSSLSHQNIVQFKSFFEYQGLIVILLEICSNKSMMELIKKRGKISEPEAMYYLKQVVDAVKYMHEHRVIHRDLKLGNIFISKSIDLKIGDFGLATVLEYDEEKKKTMCGTPNYIAPEILVGKEGHSYEVDLWSIGVIIYTWVVGKPPFETSNLKTTYKRIQSSIYEYPPHINLSPQVKDLINRLLQTDPSARPTLDEVLEHPWLQETRPKALPSIAMLRTPPRNDMYHSILTQTLKPIKLPHHGQNVNQMILSPNKRFGPSSNDKQTDKENYLNSQNNMYNDRKRKVDVLPNTLEDGLKNLDIGGDKETKTITKERESTMTRTSSLIPTSRTSSNTNRINLVSGNEENVPSYSKPTAITSSSTTSSTKSEESPSKSATSIDSISKILTFFLEGKKSIKELNYDRFQDTKPLEIVIRHYDDHSERYGISYLLYGSCFGASFNDATNIITDCDGLHVNYIERGTNGETFLKFNIQEYPIDLEKKVCLLKHFSKNLIKSKHYDPMGTPVDTTQTSQLVYVRKWLKTAQATFFRLSNSTLQVNFQDHTVIVLNNGTNCLYRNKLGKEIIFSLFDLRKQNESSSIVTRLSFISKLLDKQKRN